MRTRPSPFLPAILTLFTYTTILSTLVSAQWLPSCNYNDCMKAWNGASCTAQSGWDCLCKNATAIAQVNTCVATSCTNTTDQEAVYGAIAQICANNGVSVTNRPEATFSATSGGSILASLTAGRGGYGPGGNWGSGAWSSWVSCASTAVWSAPSGWNSAAGSWGPGWGPGWGYGSASPTGTGYYGPWGTKASGVACASGAWTTWTAGWGPFSSWTGLWSGCSTTTATPSPATVTTTVTASGYTSVVTGTTFGVQAQAAATTSASSNSATASSSAANTDVHVMSVCAGIAAALFALMVAL